MAVPQSGPEGGSGCLIRASAQLQLEGTFFWVSGYILQGESAQFVSSGPGLWLCLLGVCASGWPTPFRSKQPPAEGLAPTQQGSESSVSVSVKACGWQEGWVFCGGSSHGSEGNIKHP